MSEKNRAKAQTLKLGQKLSETLLEAVSGGEGLTGMCLFTPGGERKADIDRNYSWIECKSKCTVMCCCHGETHCVDNWHKIDSSNLHLHPDGFANHSKKRPGNKYNT